MTNQEAFDKVCKHLLTQMKPSKLGPRCRYRGPEGTMCAIGCLIPDDEYNVDFEGHNIGGIRSSVKSLRELELSLLCDLQSVHDDFDVSAWKSELKRIANDYQLDFNYE